MQLQAGYTLEAIYRGLKEYSPKSLELFQSLSYFEVETNFNNTPVPNSVNPIFAVANNIICRGLPTKMSFELELIFSDTLKKTVFNNEFGSISFHFHNSNEDFLKKIFEKLHIIEPRLSLNRSNYKGISKLDSNFEKSFLFDYIGDNNFIIQIAEPQRPITTIIQNKEKKFIHQRVDFAFQLPYHQEGISGIVVEIDGTPPKPEEFKNARDKALQEVNWKTYRVESEQQGKETISDFLGNECINFYKINYQSKYFTESDIDYLQLALSPFAIARVQKTIIEFILRGVLDLEQKEWNISIIERDVPCGYLAVMDLQHLVKNIFELEGKETKLPKINLQVYNTNEFANAKLNKGYSVKRITEISSQSQCDLLIDIAVLERVGLIEKNDYKPINYAIIRSSHNTIGKRKFYTAELIKYREVAKRLETDDYIIDESSQDNLTYFLKNIFRKENFREGQLEILSRALQGKSVIGLLPTGGGKSLTYQLAVMLQAGVSLVIDPIKSLMKDQVDNLLKAQIDACTYINSSIKSRKEKVANTDKMQNGEVLFTFISPERLQMEEFREALNEMYEKKKVYFSYCVIDEVHCVSEWGHDFRTPYLRLGENAMKFCKVKSEIKTIPLFGLTATASFDVLADVQRELKLLDDNAAIVSSKSADRPELEFEIIKIDEIDTSKITSTDDSEVEWEIRNLVGSERQNRLIRLLNELPTDMQKANEGKKNFPTYVSNLDTSNFYGKLDKTANTGLVFCPHRGSYFGVYETSFGKKENSIYSKINNDYPELRVGKFLGGDDDNDENQDDFVDNKLDILVATKAFGMGIDKPNIRFTIHFNIPSSIESFYQEAGRAGRDRKLAKCYVLWGEQKPLLIETPQNQQVYNSTVDKELLMFFHRNSFKGVEKEVWVIHELLNEITFPSAINPEVYNELLSIIFEEFGVDIWLNTWFDKETHELKSIYINYKDFDANCIGWVSTALTHGEAKEKPIDSIQAIAIRKKIIDFFKEKALIKGLSVPNFLKDFIKTKLPNSPGIQKILENDETGNLLELLIGFENDSETKINNIIQYLVNSGHLQAEITSTTHNGTITVHSDIALDKKTEFIKDACRGSVDIEEFIKKVRDKYKSYRKGCSIEISISLDYISKIENLLRQIRSEEDTYKAIYRLSVIGVIDDYTIDYNRRLFILRFKKQEKGYYLQHLYEYVRKFDLQERANRVFIDVPKITNSKGELISEIRQCLRYLVDFTYKRIAAKRKQAIEIMNTACIKGVEGGGEVFRDFINLYFNSKYANAQNDPNLVVDTEEGRLDDISIVWKYMKFMQEDQGGAIMYNLKHLRGACERMLADIPDNPVFILLKSFALFLLETKEENGKLIVLSERFLREAQNNYIEGFTAFEYSHDELLDNIKIYHQIILTYNKGLKSLLNELTDVLLIRQHSRWLQNFNKKFLKEYESANTRTLADGIA